MQERHKLRLTARAAMAVCDVLIESDDTDEAVINQNISLHLNSRPIPAAYWYEYLLSYITEKAEVEDSTLIIALKIFRDFIKLSKQISRIYLDSYLITSVLIALKMNQDVIYDFNSFSQIVNISPYIISALERNILNVLEWKVHVDTTTFNEFCFYLYK